MPLAMLAPTPCMHPYSFLAQGPIIINEDLTVYEVTRRAVEVKKRLAPTRSWGYWHAGESSSNYHS